MSRSINKVLLKYKQSTFLLFSVFILHLYFFLSSSFKAYFYWTSRIWSINEVFLKYTSHIVFFCEGCYHKNYYAALMLLQKLCYMETNMNFRDQTWNRPLTKCWVKDFILLHKYHAWNFYWRFCYTVVN